MRCNEQLSISGHLGSGEPILKKACKYRFVLSQEVSPREVATLGIISPQEVSYLIRMKKSVLVNNPRMMLG
jgi:hypothetical protein